MGGKAGADTLHSPEFAERLAGTGILIVEDEFVTAAALAKAFKQAKARVIGPVSSIAAAMERLRMEDRSEIEAAVLDIKLGTEMSYPVADELAGAAIPFVFYTGYDDASVPERFSMIDRVEKPSSVSDLAIRLIEEKGRSDASQTTSALASGRNGIDVVALLPRLRWMARQATGDAERADVLVETVLQLALDRLEKLPDEAHFDTWLTEIMAAVVRSQPSMTIDRN